MHSSVLKLQHANSWQTGPCRKHRSSCRVQVSHRSRPPTTAAGDSDVKDAQQQLGRRAALAAALLPVLASTALPSQASVSSDLLEGTQNWLSIGRESLRLWVQQAVDGVFNSDETGITDLENLDGSRPRRRFGGYGSVVLGANGSSICRPRLPCRSHSAVCYSTDTHVVCHSILLANMLDCVPEGVPDLAAIV